MSLLRKYMVPFLIALSLVALILGGGCLTKQPAEKVPSPTPMSTLVFYTEQNPPFNYVENGTLQGIGVDLLEVVTGKMGDTISRDNVHVVPWTEGYQAVLKGPNAVLFTTARLPSRESSFKWAGPIYSYTNAIYAWADRNISIASPEDLQYYRIGVIVDDIAGLQLLEAGVNRSQLVEETNASLLLAKLESGEIDLFANQEMAGRYFASQKTGNESALKVIYRLPELDGYYVFSRDVPDSTVQSFQQALDAIKIEKAETGFTEYDRILYRYLGVGCARKLFSDAAVMNLVNLTASAIEQNASDTLTRIAAAEAPYRDPVNPALYVFVFDTNVTVVSQAYNPSQIGVNFHGKTDVTGNAFRDEIVSGALENGTGWADYVFNNPAEPGLFYKTSYYRRVQGSDNTTYIVGSGTYKGCEG
jgi:polar amino acid transport system substrate-binding protein